LNLNSKLIILLSEKKIIYNNNIKMLLFYKQLITLIWKNFKSKKPNKTIFGRNITIELAIPFLLVYLGTYFSMERSRYPSKHSVKPIPISTNFKNSSHHVAFIIPFDIENGLNRDIFISKLVNNKLFSESSVFLNNEVSTYVSMEEYEKNVKYDSYRQYNLVQFNGSYSNYTIKVPGKSIVNPSANPIGDYFSSRQSDSTPADTYLNAFSPLQLIIDQAIIQLRTNKTIELDVDVGKMSKPKISNDSQNTLTLAVKASFMPIIFITQLLNIMKNILVEKENKQQEGLITIGVHPSTLWLSWEILYIPIFVVISLFVVISQNSSFFETVNFSFAFVITFIYGLSVSGLSVVFTKIFKKVTPAILITMTLYFVLSVIQQKVYDLSVDYPFLEKIICLLLSPINTNILFLKMIPVIQADKYLSFKNFAEYGLKENVYILLGSVILYHGIVLIIDFLSYTHISLFKKKGDFTPRYLHVDDIEPDPIYAGEPVVQIKNLFKIFNDRNDKMFSRAKKVNVLNGLSFNVYNNEIIAILGHNGAGKSTLIKIMTGLLHADHGSVHYDGKDINKNANFIRKNIGICLQDNFIFENLTVRENIYLYSELKNVKTNMDVILHDIDLVEKQHCLASGLSGGQKRKLCIGLALVGNPKFLFFDEPTTNLDPLSRRKIWELLLKIRENHVVFLCTHHMDEADILANRKMILNKGNIRCFGSSVFLKNHFNMKYNLNIKTENIDIVGKVVTKYIPEAEYHSQEKEVPSYHSWLVPMASSEKFSNFFTELDEMKKCNLVENFSLDAPHLENLFVKLTVETIEKRENNNKENRKNNNSNGDDKEFVDKNTFTLPKLAEVKDFSEKNKLVCFIKYRFKLISRNYTFLFVYFISTIILLGISFYSMKDLLNQKLIYNYEEKQIDSYSMYHDLQWNYDIKNSNIQNEFTADIAEKVFVSPTTQNSTFFNYNTIEEMEEIGENKGNINRIYYVSSFKGDLLNNTYKYQIYYNDSMPHALPATINSIDNGILMLNHIDEQIKVHSEPFSYSSTLLYNIAESNLMIRTCLCISLVLSFFGPMIVRERVDKLLKQLHLNGINNKNYWLGTFIIHFILLFVYLIYILAILTVLSIKSFLQFQTIIILSILLILCCVSSILVQYFMSTYFEKYENAYLIFILCNTVSTNSIIILSTTMNYFDDYYHLNGEYSTLAMIIETLSSIVYPVFSLPITFKNVMHINTMKEITGTGVTFSSLYKFNNGLLHVVLADVLGLIFYIVLLRNRIHDLEKQRIRSIGKRKEDHFEKMKKKMEESDEDVLAEYEHIAKGNLEDPEIPIKIIQVAKEYPADVHDMNYEEFMAARNNKNPKYGEIHVSDYGSGRLIVTAVEDVTLGIRNEECFGLIGPNGSGKSSLLDIITYTSVQTAGKLFYDDGIENTAIQEDKLKMGYCPQSDALWSELTLIEHLIMYLTLRGHYQAKEYAKKLLNYSRIAEHRNKYPHELSGGTRRKLCILLALICYSNKIMLDEPTSGMDPATRHYIWNILKEYIRNEKSCLIITTHSMEEAELLCHRIGILVNGTLKCIGSANHIKMKFNHIYVLEINCTSESNTEVLDTQIRRELPLLQEKNVQEEMALKGTIKYTFSITTSEFNGIFKVMEKYKNQGLIQDYSFSQTTLEDVFLKFANLQENKEI